MRLAFQNCRYPGTWQKSVILCVCVCVCGGGGWGLHICINCKGPIHLKVLLLHVHVPYFSQSVILDDPFT